MNANGRPKKYDKSFYERFPSIMHISKDNRGLAEFLKIIAKCDNDNELVTKALASFLKELQSENKIQMMPLDLNKSKMDIRAHV